MDRSQISPQAFGLMNAALGAVVTPMAAHARELTGTVADASKSLAESTRVLSREWRLVEESAIETTNKLAEILEEV